jgi:hypothetical protein
MIDNLIINDIDDLLELITSVKALPDCFIKINNLDIIRAMMVNFFVDGKSVL